ncbi:MAG: NfeD family protein [Thermoguttaceae bacterium]
MWRSHFSRCCPVIGVLVLVHLVLLPVDLQGAPAPERPLGRNKAVIIRLDGMILPFTRAFLERKLQEARGQDVDIVIVEIDSPGGELGASLDIAKLLSEVDWAETVAYVPSTSMYGALSGAAFAALGCQRIVIGKRAPIGDAGVIESDGNNPFRYVPEKQRTHVTRTIRDLAQLHKRPPALVEAMVEKDLDVFRVRNTKTGQETYMSQKELDAAPNAQEWEKGAPVEETLGGNFLEVNGARAVELGLAEANAESREELFKQLGVVGVPKVLRWSAVDTTVIVLNHPVVTALLFIIGLVALYIEMSSPGLGMGILTAGLCFALFFWSRFLGGTADWLELVLFLAGLTFLSIELFVLPGFGLAGLTGMLLLGASLILASQDFVIPGTNAELATLARSLSVLMGSMVAFLVVAAFMSRHMGSLPVLGMLMLKPPSDVVPADSPPGEGRSPALGDVGRADSALRPAGRARFGHRMLDVMTEGDFIPPGTPVRITSISGRRILVEPAPEEPAS